MRIIFFCFFVISLCHIVVQINRQNFSVQKKYKNFLEIKKYEFSFKTYLQLEIVPFCCTFNGKKGIVYFQKQARIYKNNTFKALYAFLHNLANYLITKKKMSKEERV